MTWVLIPTPTAFIKSHTSKKLLEQPYALETSGQPISTAGRIALYNRRGKLCFFHIKDEEGRFQIMIGRDESNPDQYELVKLLDLGDWFGLEGTLITTRTGECTLKADSLTLLSKAVNPLPTPKEKTEWDGRVTRFDALSDIEIRYRHRYLDLAVNNRSREVFPKRSLIIQTIREYLLEKRFLEVETPILQPLYGGAGARPFRTHHNQADMELFMRVSDELYLKRLLVGGF